MAEGTEPIRQDIDAIRDSMTDKMEQIESRVKGTVDNTVDTVKRTVDSTVHSVKRTFDLQQQVNERPWMAMGVAVLAGYVIGSLGGGGSDRPIHRGEPMRYYPSDTRSGEPMRYYPSEPRPSSSPSYYPAEPRPSSSMSYYPGGTSPGSSAYPQSYDTQAYSGRMGGRMGGQSGFMGEVMSQFGGELSMLASAAMTAGMAMLRDTISQSLPQFNQEYDRIKRTRETEEGATDFSTSSAASDDLSGLRSHAVGGTSGSSTVGSTSGSSTVGSTSGSSTIGGSSSSLSGDPSIRNPSSFS